MPGTVTSKVTVLELEVIRFISRTPELEFEKPTQFCAHNAFENAAKVIIKDKNFMI
jgi:hypothetical protein